MIHVLTPFSRVQNKEILIKFLENCNIVWHPICHTDVRFAKPWITPFYIDESTITGDPCYFKLQRFIDAQPINNDDYYCFMCDDDSYEEGYFDRIRNIKAEVIMCSTRRRDYPPLIACRENMVRCKAGLLQPIVRGKVLKMIKFEKHHIADGAMIEFLASHFDIHYEKDNFSLHNYLQQV